MTLHHRSIRFAILSISALAAASCAHKPEFGRGVTVLPVKPSVFMRATFDSDASALIGSWIPDSVDDADIDESLAARTRCSEFIKLKKIPADGNYEELVSASSGASAKLGVQSIAHVSGEHKTADALRVRYSAVEKLQSQVDTTGLSECCRIAPDQCTRRYITSAIMGDGQLYAATETSNDFGADATGSVSGAPIDGSVMYKDGYKWDRKATFSRQYFAFSVQRNQGGVFSEPAPATAGTPATATASSCDWANNVPESLDGQYFVGVSDAVPSENIGRDFAMRSAREQVVKYLGEWITNEATTQRSVTGNVAALEASLDDQNTVDRLSQGLARMVKDRKWCPSEKVATPKGQMHIVRVLAFFPNTERAAAAKNTIVNLIAFKKENGTLSPEQEKQLQAMADAIK